MNNTATPPEPIRLRVSYKSAESLLGEFTRSVGKGSVSIESRKPLAPGRRFIFEMWAKEVPYPVEVLGEVIHCNALGPEQYLLSVRYDPGSDRYALDEILRLVFASHEVDKIRRHARVPLSLSATEDVAYSPSYAIRDMSLGGMGIDVDSSITPRAVKAGEPFWCEIRLSLGTLTLHGEVLWVASPAGERAAWANHSFGVRFGRLRPDMEARLGELLALRGLPPAPWRARLSFGPAALHKMP